MAEPVVIKAEPATMQVRTAAQESGEAGAHVLAIALDTAKSLYHGSCSCSGWSMSYVPDAETIRVAHRGHQAAKLRVSDG